MGLDEMESKYAPLWLAVKVTARDGRGQPTRGIVLCQHMTRLMLFHELSKVAEKEVCIFQAIRERHGVVVMI